MNVRFPLLRRLRLALTGPCRAAPRWQAHREMFKRAVLIVQVFYAVTAYRMYGESRDLTHLSGSADDLDLLWPVMWMRFVPLETAGWLLAHLALGAGFAGLLFWRFRPVRVLLSLALLELMALGNSYGGTGHGAHEWFWISVCFWFLPTGRPRELEASRFGRTDFLYAFGMAPALILFFYTLSGLYKLLHATVALLQGEFGGFSPEALAVTVARRALETGSEPMWAEPIIAAPLLGWPLYLGLYFVEVVSIAVFFRPVLHRAWGVILIAFHFGTLLLLDIIFPLHVLINALFFVMSPFAPDRSCWRAMLAAVPFVGVVFRRGFGWSVHPSGVSIRAAGVRAA